MKLIKFEKKDCKPCENLSKYLNSKNVEFETINAFDFPEMAMKYKLTTVPVLILIDENGNEFERVVGFGEDKKEKIDKLLANYKNAKI